jgi:RNA polymerase sigma-70 factor, ECF subfamily
MKLERRNGTLDAQHQIYNSKSNPPQPLWHRSGRMQDISAGTSESQLIRLAADGEARAIRTLYDRYAPRVYAVVRRIAGDDDLAQDYAQEAWIRAIRALPTFRGDARFSTWLHRIAVNAALQALRKSETRRKREAPIPDQIPIAPNGGDALLQKQLERALDTLPEGMRRVLMLHDVEGFTHEEIGDSLGVTSGTSKSQLFKARAKMRDLLTTLAGASQENGAEAWSI